MLYDEEASGEINSSQKAMEEILRVILDSNDDKKRLEEITDITKLHLKYLIELEDEKEEAYHKSEMSLCEA